MKEQHTKLIDNKSLESKNEQGSLVCCNTKSIPCSFLGFNINNNSESVALDYLASVLVEAFLDLEEDERNNTNKQ